MYQLKSNREIDNCLLDKLAALEEKIFGEKAVGSKIFKNIHSKRHGGLFALVDDQNDPVGFMDAIFLSDEQTKQYLKDHDYRKLNNTGVQKEKDNILYIFDIAVVQELRGTEAVKMLIILGASFAQWLKGLKDEGIKFKYIFCDAVSPEGAKAAAKSMGMKPVKKTFSGLGFYYSPDNLENYIKKNAGVITTLKKPYYCIPIAFL